MHFCRRPVFCRVCIVPVRMSWVCRFHDVTVYQLAHMIFWSFHLGFLATQIRQRCIAVRWSPSPRQNRENIFCILVYDLTFEDRNASIFCVFENKIAKICGCLAYVFIALHLFEKDPRLMHFLRRRDICVFVCFCRCARKDKTFRPDRGFLARADAEVGSCCQIELWSGALCRRSHTGKRVYNRETVAHFPQ